MIEGINLVSEYKYLGMWLNNKVTLEFHLGKMEKKITFVGNRVKMALNKDSSMKLRVNLWQVMIQPYFDQAMLLAWYNSESQLT